jgi:hypothetical protein
MHGVIICRKGMECYHPMEFDYILWRLRRLGSILSCVLIVRKLTVLMDPLMRIKLWSGEVCFPFA